jgi:hypothetical protein
MFGGAAFAAVPPAGGTTQIATKNAAINTFLHPLFLFSMISSLQLFLLLR